MKKRTQILHMETNMIYDDDDDDRAKKIILYNLVEEDSNLHARDH